MTQLDLETITPQRANDLWRMLQHGGMDDFNAQNPEIFAARLAAPDTVCFEHPRGLAMLSGIHPRLNADIHFWSWGGLSDAEIVRFGREVMKYAFDTYQLERITAAPPAFNKMAARIAVRLGFKYEGTFRHSFLFHGKYMDVFIYGIVRSEFEKTGDVQ